MTSVPAEAPRERGTLGEGGEPFAHPLHVRLERGIVHDPDRRQHLGVSLAAELDLLPLADERELPLARGRVRRAGGAGEEGRREGGAEGPSVPPHLETPASTPRRFARGAISGVPPRPTRGKLSRPRTTASAIGDGDPAVPS
jgi:hypothetical protein